MFAVGHYCGKAGSSSPNIVKEKQEKPFRFIATYF